MLRACVVTIKTTSTDYMRDKGRFHLSPAASIATLAALAVGLITAVVLPAYMAARGHGLPAPIDLLGAAAGNSHLRGLMIAAVYIIPALVWAAVLERRFPLEESHPAQTTSRGWWFDLFWYFNFSIRQLTWIPLFVLLVAWIKSHLLGNFQLSASGAVPRLALLAVGILIGDFFGYVCHIAQHRYGFLWHFHSVHHSQLELNFFTQDRVHDFDTLTQLSIRLLPVMILSPGLEEIFAYYIVFSTYTHLYHCPIRSNYGSLRYFVVTPQSHRVHHSSDPSHYNSNFGIILTIWDRIFGTAYRSYDEYPSMTGSGDSAFPVEQEKPAREWAQVYAAQLVYPFVKVVRSASEAAERKRFKSAGSPRMALGPQERGIQEPG
jgi:sterol desaturase/sphingolipid hydroxylase (fatty acid hydroxylase superfamily)